MASKVFGNLVCKFMVLFGLSMSQAFGYTDRSPNQSYRSYDGLFEKTVGDKHYVKPGTIFVSADGLFLIVQGELIPLTSIAADEGGIFIRAGALKYGTCPVCTWPLTPEGKSSNPQCPTNH